MSTSTDDLLAKFDDEFPKSSCFIEIDNGYREVNGERVSGFHVHACGPGWELPETTVATMSEALALALKAVE